MLIGTVSFAAFSGALTDMLSLKTRIQSGPMPPYSKAIFLGLTPDAVTEFKVYKRRI